MVVPGHPDPIVVQDVMTPAALHALDNQYSKDVLSRNVIFTSDAGRDAPQVTADAMSVLRNAFTLGLCGSTLHKFVVAMVKMVSIEVKTGVENTLSCHRHWGGKMCHAGGCLRGPRA